MDYVISLLIYFAPTFTAIWRAHPKRRQVFACNVLFGITGVGWVVTLAYALGDLDHKPELAPVPQTLLQEYLDHSNQEIQSIARQAAALEASLRGRESELRQVLEQKLNPGELTWIRHEEAARAVLEAADTRLQMISSLLIGMHGLDDTMRGLVANPSELVQSKSAFDSQAARARELLSVAAQGAAQVARYTSVLAEADLHNGIPIYEIESSIEDLQHLKERLKTHPLSGP